MKKTIWLRTFLLFVLFSVTAPSWAVTILGASPCGEWVNDRKNARPPAWQSEKWVIGYLSGLSVATGREFWKKGGNDLSNESVYLWMDNYCKANPLKRTDEGADELFRDYTKK